MPAEKRILVVDDDSASRTLLFTILRRRGFAVDSARNGSEALEKLGRCRYVLMLLDLMMPVLSGWEVLQYLSAVEPAERPVVILLTPGGEARDFDPDVVVGSVRKPFDLELLHDTVIGCIIALPAKTQLNGCPPAESQRRE